MIGTPEIAETRPRAAAVIHVTVPRDEYGQSCRWRSVKFSLHCPAKA
jgi:hypothetical protein